MPALLPSMEAGKAELGAGAVPGTTSLLPTTAYQQTLTVRSIARRYSRALVSLLAVIYAGFLIICTTSQYHWGSAPGVHSSQSFPPQAPPKPALAPFPDSMLESQLGWSALPSIPSYLSLFTSPFPLSPPPPAPADPTTPEAYALFFPSSGPGTREYLLGALLLLFKLRVDPFFADPTRDVVVITTDLVSSADHALLARFGARIHTYPSINDGFPDLAGHKEVLPHYRLVYNKLRLWQLEQYERVLYLDNDLIMRRPIRDVWQDPQGVALLSDEYSGGVAATADPGWEANGDREAFWKDGSYFNSGLMMLRPNATRYEEMKLTKPASVRLVDQDLLNEFFQRDGPYPWRPLNHSISILRPTTEDDARGAKLLHTKGWPSYKLASEKPMEYIFWEQVGRMGGWYDAMRHAETVAGHGDGDPGLPGLIDEVRSGTER